jgi:hypothetical protein
LILDIFDCLHIPKEDHKKRNNGYRYGSKIKIYLELFRTTKNIKFSGKSESPRKFNVLKYGKKNNKNQY